MSEERPIDVQPESSATVYQPVGKPWSSIRERRRRAILLTFVAGCFGFALYTFLFKPEGWLQAYILPEGHQHLPEFNQARVGFLTATLTDEGRIDSTIPTAEIRYVGIDKDSIPSLSFPPRVAAAHADFLKPDERVLGIVFNGEAAAYPLRILSFHEAVNDHVGGKPVLVTYSPLCDSAAVFDRKIGDRTIQFGVSGYLYNGNMLLYDRDSPGASSLWSQLKSESVTGQRAAWRLAALPLELTVWSDWVQRYPQTRVISDETGHRRDYDHDPYQKYAGNKRVWYSPKLRDDRLPAKARVLGLWTKNASRVYVLPEKDGFPAPVEFTHDFDGRSLRIHCNSAAGALRVAESDASVKWMYAYWFAWYAFHPESEVYTLTGPADNPAVALPPASGSTLVR